MKRNIVFTISFIVALLVSACSQSASFSSKESSDKSLLSIAPSGNISSVISSEESSYSNYVPVAPSREGGISLEAFTDEVKKLEEQTNNKKIRITYHIVETLEGSVPGATYRNGDPLLEGETVTDLVLESKNNSSTDLKLINGQTTTQFADTFKAGISITVKDWLSYHKERRSAAEREAQRGWNIFNECLKINPCYMWMVYAGNNPPNAGVEGTFFAYNEYERTFDQNGYCQNLLFREYTYIDGTFSRWDNKPQYYKGTFDAVARATIEYID